MAKARKKDKSPDVDKKQPKSPHALPEGNATGEERALALFHRLYPGCYQWQSSPAMWIAIGQALALKEPEFSRGSGAKRGSTHKDHKAETEITEASRHKRNQRANKAKRDRTIFIPGIDDRDEELVLEDGVDADMVKSALASIERQKK
jgi:hypothetical protein